MLCFLITEAFPWFSKTQQLFVHHRLKFHSAYEVYFNLFNPTALRTAKTQWSFGHSECSRVNALFSNYGSISLVS